MKLVKQIKGTGMQFLMFLSKDGRYFASLVEDASKEAFFLFRPDTSKKGILDRLEDLVTNGEFYLGTETLSREDNKIVYIVELNDLPKVKRRAGNTTQSDTILQAANKLTLTKTLYQGFSTIPYPW